MTPPATWVPPFWGDTSPARSQPSALGQKPLKGVPITPHILPWLCPPLTAPAPTQGSVLGPWVMGCSRVAQGGQEGSRESLLGLGAPGFGDGGLQVGCRMGGQGDAEPRKVRGYRDTGRI